MKKILLILLVVCMLCISMSTAGFSQIIYVGSEDENIFSGSYTTEMESTTNMLKETINQYMDMDVNRFEPYNAEPKTIDLPWSDLGNSDLLCWVVHLEYNGQAFDEQVDVSIGDFSEKFLKHPEYGEILRFDIDSDSADDVEVIVGFYWSYIKYPDGQDARSLELRYRIRQTSSSIPGGGIEDQDAELEVWSQLRVNYGLIKIPGRSKPTSNSALSNFNSMLAGKSKQDLLTQFLERFALQRENDRFTLLRNLLKNILDDSPADEDIAPLASDNGDADYICMGSGYRSPEGKKIPLLVEKRFSFAKSFNWNWRNEGSLFNPTIFEHELYEVTSSDPIELLYGFQAYKGATDTKMFDVAFTVEFNPPVYLRTKYIPLGSYVYYYFDQKSQRYGETEATFSADVIVGEGFDVPEIVLTFDKIDDTLGRSGRWFSIDIDADIFGPGDMIGFHYKASHKFDVGIKVNVPSLFEEEVQIKGMPTSIDIGWDVYVDVILLPKIVDVTFGGKLKLDMNSDIDQVVVYYPKSDPGGDDEVFIDVEDIPSDETLTAEASLYLDTVGGRLHVKPSGSVDMKMSSSIGEINIYYPKAVSDESDIKFLYIPAGSIPSRAEVGGELEVYILDPDTLSNPSNFIAGNIYHDCDKNVDEVNFYIPSNQETPIIQITDMPADSYAEGRLYWNKLEGHAYGTRGYLGNRDPIILNLEFGGYEIYNKLEIEEGYLRAGFKIAEDGYFYFDTSKNLFKNELRVNNNGAGSTLDKLYLQVEDISADNIHANWDIDTSGEQMKFNSLGFGGIVDTIRDFHLEISLEGKSSNLDLDWILGKTGKIEVDFQQDEPIRLDFDLDDASDDIDLHGYVELPNNPHFDMSWKWHQGERHTDPGYFKINENTNERSIEDVYLYFTYLDQWGTEVSLSNAGIYVCVEWYWYNLLLYIWPVIDVYGDLDLHLLLDGTWYYNVEDWVNPP